MLTACPVNLDPTTLESHIRAEYSRLAQSPEGDFHFHRGPVYASALLGYDASELATLPADAVSRFAGVGNPLRLGPIEDGDVVADIGCGAGTDLLLAARRVGPLGRAFGIDRNPAMRALALRNARMAGLGGRVDVREGSFAFLPLPDASVDVVISNGVLNLCVDKLAALREVRRVLRPGGRLYLADAVVRLPFSADNRSQAALWAACVAGAMPEQELLLAAAEAGLRHGRIVERFDAFRDTPAGSKVAPHMGLAGANFYATA